MINAVEALIKSVFFFFLVALVISKLPGRKSAKRKSTVENAPRRRLVPREQLPVDNARTQYTAISKPTRRPYTQYVFDTKNQIAKAVKGAFESSQVEVSIPWRRQADRDIENRVSFPQEILLNKKQYYMRVIFEKRTLMGLTFSAKKLDPIFFKKPIGLKDEKTNRKGSGKTKHQNRQSKNKPVSISDNVQINPATGKPEIKPNYKMIALEWIKENLAYINKCCNDAFSSGTAPVEATLLRENLPTEEDSWPIIAALLKEQGEIDSFKLTNEGIRITIN